MTVSIDFTGKFVLLVETTRLILLLKLQVAEQNVMEILGLPAFCLRLSLSLVFRASTVPPQPDSKVNRECQPK